MTAARSGARARGAARGAGALLVSVLSAVVLLPVGTSLAEAPAVPSGSATAPLTSPAPPGRRVATIGAAAAPTSSSSSAGGAARAATPATAPEPVPSARRLPGAPSSRDLGLVVLLAVVLLAGVASLLVRVLLAEPRPPAPGTAPHGAGRPDRPVPGPELSDPAARL